MIKKNIFLISIMCICMVTSCTDFIAKAHAQTEWVVYISQSDLIILHVRPENFTHGHSPTREEALKILSNQEIYYNHIITQLGDCVFEDPILIYLYNREEALELIGTQGGGHAVPKFNTVYYTYIPYEEGQAYTDRYGIENPLIGAHETAHVISHRALGYPKTKLMSEGYANWLDGSYGRKDIHAIYNTFSDQEKLTPTQMLLYESIREAIYYPNCGVFIEYLVDTYGVEIVNSLFTHPAHDIPSRFYEETGISWIDMEAAYLGQ